MSKRLLEKYVQVVRMDGINTNKDVTIGVNGVIADLSVSGDLTVGGSINFAATTFDDPVTFQDTVSAEGLVTFESSGSATFEGPIIINSAFNNHGIQTGISQPGPTSGSVSFPVNYTVFQLQITGNATIDLSRVGEGTGQMVTFVLESVGGGETVDFTGTGVTSTGTLNMGAGAGDRFTISFVSDGLKWREVSRTAAQS